MTELLSYTHFETCRANGYFFIVAPVGAVGFLVNAIAVTAASCVVDLYTTEAIGWLVAVTVTRCLNRNWTFRPAQK
ncbi:GtrA family protein [Bradyrhizobium diazoefficiens]|nr:hypothetical protein HAU57_41970 [Bradyrhizobium diazoefficiens]UQD92043.1 GtrA family protein [Bradyrhizobium diazoefficiens]